MIHKSFNSTTQQKLAKSILVLMTLTLPLGNAFSQIVEFEFNGIAGNEVSVPVTNNDANIVVSDITRGTGCTATNNGDRFNANNWTQPSLAAAVANNDYMEITITPNIGCTYDVSSIVLNLARSGTGPPNIAIRSSADAFTADLGGQQTPPAGGSRTFTFTQTGLSVATTYRFYMWGNTNGGGTAGIGDGAGPDLIVNGSTSCTTPSNTISTGLVSNISFDVECATPLDAAGTIDFTSTGTFLGGNVYTAQLSDATGNFATPPDIGTLNTTANSGTINITIPAGPLTGTGYLIRVISDNPVTIGTSSTLITINQNAPCPPSLPAVGMIINEWSNGATGNQEYYEFVVAGDCGQLVDIREYILDDNNATFTNPIDYDATASGIAPGHFRFTNAAQWGSIPVGSVIVIYNAEDPNPDLPADDPTDANNDSLYVVPHTSSLFERCTTLPTSASPDSVYAPCTYAFAPLNGWGALSLRNSGDAIQVRLPNGSYYHGVSYGGSEMTGGPDNLKLFTGSGAGQVGWFNDGDPFDISNWNSGSVAGNQTPGTANNPINAAWLLLMRDSTNANCPVTVLPVEIAEFLGQNAPEGNILYWSTLSERDADFFLIERSTNGKDWTEIGTVNAVGNSTDLNKYQIIDVSFASEINYYRLKQFDNDGTMTKHSRIVSIDNMERESTELIGIYNLLGQQVDASFKGVQIRLFSDGSSQRVYKY